MLLFSIIPSQTYLPLGSAFADSLCRDPKSSPQVLRGIYGARSMQHEGLGGVADHLPLVTPHGTALRVPYMKRLKGSLRVLLFFYYSTTNIPTL